MNKPLIIALAVIALVTAWFVLSDGGSRGDQDGPLGTGPVVAIGDSLVEGVGATRGKDFVSILSRALGEEIVNLGVSGNTSAQVLERVTEATDLKPRAAILLVGGNDFLRKVPREQVFQNIAAIVERLQASGARVLLLGVRGGLLSDSAAEMYEDIADATGAAYVPDVLDGLFGDSRYMSDSIHPNDQGYARIADRVYPALRRLLE